MYIIHYSIEISVGDIIIRDPVTVLTNLMIVATGVLIYRRLLLPDIEYSPARTWRWFFMGIAASSLIGVIVHGFSYYTSLSTHRAIWLTMGFVQAAGISAAQLAAAQQHLPHLLRTLRPMIVVQLLLTLIALVVLQTYDVIKLHVAIGLIPVMSWKLTLSRRGFQYGSWIGGGILVSALTAAVHTFKISLSPWLNYNDIAHLLVVISLGMIGKGVVMANRHATLPLSA